jgi:3-hydroxyisobutyrate dehydrogenase-like beta-hydroxyacid dehydrogenase
MSIGTVGLLSPGDMGHSVGAVLQRNGLQVLTCFEGRSERSRTLAAEAGIEDGGTLNEIVEVADIFLSILPPAAARENATRVATALRATGSSLLYVDCNAIAPSTARDVAAIVTAAGARMADVGIIGAPPRRPGTRFYVSGPGADEFAQLRDYGLDVRVLEGDVGQASGLKMCYGALTKGLQALGVELLVAARAMGLEEALRAEQQQSTPDVRGWIENAIPTMPPKAYRWVGEMEEIAVCFGDVGLTPKIFEGVADLYRFVETTAIGHETPENRDTSRDGMGVVAALADELAERAG